MLHTDYNPILDDGAPTSTAEMMSATRFADLLEATFELEAATTKYSRGWGPNCSDSILTLGCWRMVTNDQNGKATALMFDVFAGNGSVIFGLDVKRYCDNININNQNILRRLRPEDKTEKLFHTYITADGSGNDRLRIELLPHLKTQACNYMSKNTVGKEKVLETKIDRVTYASKNEYRQLLRAAGIRNEQLEMSHDRCVDNCDICTSSGRPHNKWKISISYINQAFNEKIQVDFLVAYICREKFVILNIVDMVTTYGEREIVANRSAETTQMKLEKLWIFRHGSARRFSADPEFCRPVLKNFLQRHGIQIVDRPSRSSNKNGVVERNNRVFKNILERIQRENTAATPAPLMQCASSFPNMFHDNKLLSSFQLSRGYTPSIAGLPSSRPTETYWTPTLKSWLPGQSKNHSRAIHPVLPQKMCTKKERPSLCIITLQNKMTLPDG